MIIKNPSKPLKLTLINFTANIQPAQGIQINCKVVVVVVIHSMWWKRRREKTEISVKEIKRWVEINNKLSELEKKCKMLYEIIDALGNDLQSTEQKTREPEIIRILNRSSENITMKTNEEQEHEITDEERKWKRFNDQLKTKMNDVSNKIETGIYNEETQWYTSNKELRMWISNVTVKKGPANGRQEFYYKRACIGTHASKYNCRCNNNTYIRDLLKSTVDKIPRCKPLFGLKTKLPTWCKPSKIKPILKKLPQNHKKTQTNITITNISNLQSPKATSVHSLDSNYALVLAFPSIESIATKDETISRNSSYSEFSTIISLNSYDSTDSKNSIKSDSDSIFISPPINEIKSIKKKAEEDASPSFKRLTTPIAIKRGDRSCVCTDYGIARKTAAENANSSFKRAIKRVDRTCVCSDYGVARKTAAEDASPSFKGAIKREDPTCVCSDYGVARKTAATSPLASRIPSVRSMKASDQATTISPTRISIKKKDKTIMDYTSPGTSKKTITSIGTTSTESHAGTQTEKDSFSTSLKPSFSGDQGTKSLGSKFVTSSKSLTDIDQASQKSSVSLKYKTSSTSSGASSSSTKLKNMMKTAPSSLTQLTTQTSSARLEDETTSTNFGADSSSTKLKSMMKTVSPSSTQLTTQTSSVRLENEATSTNFGAGISSTRLKSMMKTVPSNLTQLTTKSSVRLENEATSTNFGAGSSRTRLKSMVKMVPSSSTQLTTKSSVRLEDETTSASSGSFQSRKSRTSSESSAGTIQSILWIKSTGSIQMRKSGKSPSGSSESVKSTERTRKSRKSNESLVSIETIKSTKSLTESQRNISHINLKEATINESPSKRSTHSTNCCPLFKFFKKGNDKPKNDRQKNVKKIQDATQNTAISDEESSEHFRLEVKESTNSEDYESPSMESRYQVFPVVTTYKSDTKCLDTRYSKTTNIEMNELLPLLVMLPEFKKLDDQVYELIITLYPVKHADNYCGTELCPRTLPVTVNTRYSDCFPLISRGPRLQRSECQIYTQMQSQPVLQPNAIYNGKAKGQMTQIDDALFLFNLNMGMIKNVNKIEKHTVTQTKKESFSTSLKPSVSTYQGIQSLESKFVANSKSLTNIGQATQKISVSLKYRTTPISSGAGSSIAKLKSMNSIKTVPTSKSPEKRTSVQTIEPSKFSTSSKSIQSILWIKSTGSIRMRKPTKSPTVSSEGSAQSTERTRSKENLENDSVFVESKKTRESLAANLVSAKSIISTKSPTETSGDIQRVKRNKSQRSQDLLKVLNLLFQVVQQN